jgi:hypothetical protein
MAIDDVPVQAGPPVEPRPISRGLLTTIFVIIFLVLAAVVIGEFFTVSRMNTLRETLVAQQNQVRDELNGQLRNEVSNRLSAIEQQNAQELDAVKTELDQAAKRVGAQSGELKRARNIVAQLQDQQRTQAEQVQQQLSEKADQKQVGALSQDVTSTKSDLNNTQKTVNTLVSDLGMARSEMGNLIARNHQDIEYLRKMGDRDYFEFTLTKGHEDKVAGVGLTLKKTNVKRYRYSLDTLADDIRVERKDCTVNAPVYFYVSGFKKPYELVVNRVEANQVKGYVSTPKGVSQVTASTEGAH